MTDQIDLLEIARQTGLRRLLHGVNAQDARSVLTAFVRVLRIEENKLLARPGTEIVVGIDHGRGDDETTVMEGHFAGGVLHVDEIHTGDLAKAVAVYWEAYKRQQAGSPRRAGACAAGVAAVLRYARTGPLTLLNLSDTDARAATRYRWWRDNLQLLTDDEAGLHGVAFSFQVPWNFIERATSGEVADAIADAAISAQRVEVS